MTYVCLSDFYLGRTIHIIQLCIQRCIIIVYNVKHVNGETVCSFNAAVLLCVGDSIFVVIIYNSVIFLDRSSFEDVLLYFSSFGPSRLARGVV
jgi:hypothetical protein